MTDFNYKEFISRFPTDKEYSKRQVNPSVNQPYFDLCNYFSALIQDNINKIIEDDSLSKTKKIEYAKKCKNLHRGYYCPSPVYDIIVTNSHRGHIVKKGIYDKSVNFDYHFDENNRIFLINEYIDGEKVGIEKIYYKDNHSYGFNIADGMLLTFSYCEYCEDLISSYSFANINPFDFSITHLEVEKYKYNNDNLISEADLFSFIRSKNLPLSQQKYYFTHNENGLLNSYRVENYINGQRICLGIDECSLYISIPKYKMRKV